MHQFNTDEDYGDLQEGHTMPTYRCTRNKPYEHECKGKYDLSAREGYYVITGNADKAYVWMVSKFPQEVCEGFTVEKWSN